MVIFGSGTYRKRKGVRVFPVTLKIDWSQAPLLMNRSLLTDLFRNEHCAHSNCRPRQALGTDVIPPGDVYWEKSPMLLRQSPVLLALKNPLKDSWFPLHKLRDMRSLDPQVDNFSRQSRGTVQQWKGTAHLHATVVQSQVFLCVKQCHYTLWRPSLSSYSVTTTLAAITVHGLHHYVKPIVVIGSRQKILGYTPDRV